MHKRQDIAGGIKERVIGSLIGGLIHVYSKLLRCEVDKHPSVDMENQASIYCFWHNRVLLTPEIWQRLSSTAQLTCLTSASKDGTITAAVMAAFGIGAVRGSSSRRGKQAMIDMIRVLRAGSSLAITPDGPRGPRENLDPGLIKLAAKTRTPIVPASVEYSSYWELKTWDRFRLPKPFSTVKVTMTEPLIPPPKLSEEEVLEFKSQLETILSR